MNMDRTIKRGDLYYADLDPVFGSEQGGVRPVVVVQNDTGNRFSPTIIVAPITSHIKKESMPTHTILEDYKGLASKSMVLAEQVRAIDKGRLRNSIGMLSQDDLCSLDDALSVSVGFTDRQRFDDNEMILCLCSVCANQFYQSPKHVIKRVDPLQQYKDVCTYCSVRRGYDYKIAHRRKKLSDECV